MALPTNIHEVPFLRLLIPLMGGIIAQSELYLLPHAEWVLLVLPLAVVLLFAVRLTIWWRWGRIAYTFAVAVVMFFAGLTLGVGDDFGDTLPSLRPVDVVLRLDDAPQRRVRSIRAEGVVVGVVDEARVLRPHRERLLCYLNAADTMALELRHGDLLAMRVVPQQFASPSNPYQFDFAAYMYQRGIKRMVYVDSAAWSCVGKEPNNLRLLAISLRNKLLGVFERAGLPRDELAVVSALTVGYKDLLDDALRRTYSAAGAMHILAVSGLHVGVVYGLLLLLLRLVPRLDWRVKLLLSLLFLWLFALITGLSASVMRATAMFSLVELGRCLGYRSNSYNTLAAVAFILLLIDPKNLYNIGFQLSFLAVLSIMMFYPHIRNLLYIKYKPLSLVWDLLSVSLAAQIGTLPITLLNFGQFSNYFLLTNILATPMASIIIYLSVLLLIVQPMPLLFAGVGKVLELAVWLLNSGLRGIEALPGALSQGIYCSPVQALLLVMTIAALAAFLEQRRLRTIFLMLGMLCLFVLLQQHRIDSNRSSELVIFDVQSHSVVAVKCGGQALFFDTDTFPGDIVARHSFQLSGYAERCAGVNFHHLNCPASMEQLKRDGVVHMHGGLAIVSAEGFRLAFPYSDSCRHLIAPAPIDVDVLLLNRHACHELLGLVRPRVAVIDASMRNYRLPQLAIKFMVRGAFVYDVQAQGAYRSSLTSAR